MTSGFRWMFWCRAAVAGGDDSRRRSAGAFDRRHGLRRGAADVLRLVGQLSDVESLDASVDLQLAGVVRLAMGFEVRSADAECGPFVIEFVMCHSARGTYRFPMRCPVCKREFDPATSTGDAVLQRAVPHDRPRPLARRRRTACRSCPIRRPTSCPSRNQPTATATVIRSTVAASLIASASHSTGRYCYNRAVHCGL